VESAILIMEILLAAIGNSRNNSSWKAYAFVWDLAALTSPWSKWELLAWNWFQGNSRFTIELSFNRSSPALPSEPSVGKNAGEKGATIDLADYKHVRDLI
jgi:hypothetical protein